MGKEYSRRDAIRLMLGMGGAAATSGCYITGINKPGQRIIEPNPLFTTSFTNHPGEENLYVLCDIARLVAKNGKYERNCRVFIAARDYSQVCKEMGLIPSTEPPVLIGTKLNIRDGDKEKDYIPDTSGSIHFGGDKVVKVIGEKISKVRKEIQKTYPTAEINFVTREGDPVPNLGQIYFYNLKTGKGGQEPLCGRRLEQLGTKLGGLMAGDYLFVFRENSDHYFGLIAEMGELILDPRQNVKLGHNDIVVGGDPDTLIENLEELLHKSAACWRSINAFK